MNLNCRYRLKEVFLGSRVLWVVAWSVLLFFDTHRVSAQTVPATPPSSAFRFSLPQAPPPAEPVRPATPTNPPPAAPVINNGDLLVPRTDSVDDPGSLESLLAQVTQQLQRISTDSERTPEVKDALLKSYEQMRVDLDTAIKLQQKRRERLESISAAPSLLDAARIRREQDQASKPTPSNEGGDRYSFEEVEQRRQVLEAELAAATAERVALSDRMTRREKRRKELPQLISDLKGKLEQLASLPPPANTEDPLTREMARLSTEITQRLLAEQLQSFEVEQRLYEAEATLLPVQLELAQRAEKRLQDRVRTINEQLDKIRTDRILARYSEAKRLTIGLPSKLRPVGQQLLEQIEAWMELANNQASIKSELDTARKLLDRWSERRVQMNNRVSPTQDGVASFNIWVGMMLRKQRGELPELRQLESRIYNYQAEMQQTEALLFNLEDSLLNVKLRLESVQEQLQEVYDPDDADPQATHAAALLKLAADVMQTIKLDANAYLTDLYEIADVRTSTIQLSKEYRAFIDKHVLWIRSTEPLSQAHWQPGVEAFRWLVDYQNWQSTGWLLLLDAQGSFGWYILFILGFISIVFNQARLRRKIGDYSAKAEKNNCTDFGLTGRGLLLTVLISIPAPLSMLFLHWRLTTVAHSLLTQDLIVDYASALARGLLLAASLFLPLELLRQLSRLGGLGIKHFGWQESIARRLSTNLRWLIDFSIPLCMVIGLFLNHVNERWEASLGRAAFVLLMPILSLFLARVFSPSAGIARHYIEQHRDGWLDRLSLVWFTALIMLPLALATVSLVGYHYTALRLALHMHSSLWTIVTLTVVYFTLLRLLMLNRRRLMLAQARQRLEEASRRESQTEPHIAAEESRVDLVAVNEQTKRLVTSLIVVSALVMTFVIWSDVLPAVSLLDQITLWPVDDSVTITLANLLTVIPAIVLTIIAGRNVPGLLEIAILANLPLTNAARYAITTLSRYAIITAGIVFIFSTLGLRWSSIQWLVAALGVGLGFGLQEIFANFVSGLILLFEQPIRVGDIVSIDGTTGKVAKIRMRATTVINWDRQELIVPNKTLITGKLLNWTLTDSTNRVTINVGVAYGCDTQRACELIMQACQEHPNVVVDPNPSVTFEGFGDNSLNLVLRAFLDSLDNRLKTIHELHQAIYKAFNEAGISIAFPQRDLHIRTLPDSWNRWLESQPKELQPRSSSGRSQSINGSE